MRQLSALPWKNCNKNIACIIPMTTDDDGDHDDDHTNPSEKLHHEHRTMYRRKMKWQCITNGKLAHEMFSIWFRHRFFIVVDKIIDSVFIWCGCGGDVGCDLRMSMCRDMYSTCTHWWRRARALVERTERIVAKVCSSLLFELVHLINRLLPSVCSTRMPHGEVYTV